MKNKEDSGVYVQLYRSLMHIKEFQLLDLKFG